MHDMIRREYVYSVRLAISYPQKHCRAFNISCGGSGDDKTNALRPRSPKYWRLRKIINKGEEEESG